MSERDKQTTAQQRWTTEDAWMLFFGGVFAGMNLVAAVAFFVVGAACHG